ncbi:MAG: DUF1292 domain-containing protein [Eubacteriales bacterium]
MDTNNTEREFFTLTDEEGNEIEFELIGAAELDGNQYYAFIPAEDDPDKEFCEYTILKVIVEDGEESLVSIDDDAEFDKVADYFDDLFASEIDYDA